MAKNFPTLGKERDIQIQEAQRVSNKMNPKRLTQRHIIGKMSKVKDKERICYVQENPIKLSADFQQKLCRPEGSGTIY